MAHPRHDAGGLARIPTTPWDVAFDSPDLHYREIKEGRRNMQVYLTAPGGIDVSTLATVVRDLNWGIMGAEWRAGAVPISPRDSIIQADAVIVVGGSSGMRDLNAVMLEAGIAIGVNKPLLLIWDDAAPFPHDLGTGYRVTHISLSNLGALRFHVGLFLANAKQGALPPRPRRRPPEPSAPNMLDLSRRLSDLQSRPASPEDFEKWIEDLFRAVDIPAVRSSDRADRGFDIVVGAPFGSELDGPVLVETKTYWPSPEQLARLVERLDNVVASQQASRGIVAVLAKERSLAGDFWLRSSPRVAALGADDLLRIVSTGTPLTALFGPLNSARGVRL